ncbi:Crp/Fnr family transcriptional regulator [Pedobacter nyackensis]|uniref:CRP/FNR family transcriptional regulator, anaerobic regulatory protein n=1 Tax=Pedobacter nyackensis TaxID=475255 RepID=A0A1W2DXE7_9SPHI|nr:Crp/Fnr family transcriptional regulator [Pedobacter nyackensis]SMD01736.1 CRP/FNR family transcriptional regulator, anaerobic regulatory protein [Pedobacter nyackensis]
MKECGNACDLKTCFLCKLCLPEWLPALAVQKRNFEVKKGELIFKEGDAVNGIYFVHKGSFKVHKSWDKDKELIIRFARSADIIGHMGLGKRLLYPVSATALEPSVVCYLEIAFFEATLKVNTELAYQLIRFLANELDDSHRSMRDLAHMSVKARIAQAFISLHQQFGIDEQGFIDVEISRQDISSFAGTTYETLFKVLNEFAKQSILTLTGRKIFIADHLKLQEIVNNDH